MLTRLGCLKPISAYVDAVRRLVAGDDCRDALEIGRRAASRNCVRERSACALIQLRPRAAVDSAGPTPRQNTSVRDASE